VGLLLWQERLRGYPIKILVIPDVQARPDIPLEHLTWLGNYIVSKRPDIIVCLGDFADMSSLSSYDQGKKSFEGRRYKTDIATVHQAMKLLFAPMHKLNRKRSLNSRYLPRLVMTMGNHEERILRAIENDPKLDGTLSLDDLGYKAAGWEVIPFLKPININGVIFCHYFTTGVMGRPVTSATALLTKKHQSAIMGHVQKREIAFATRADGRELTAIFAGTYYQHDENYLGPQGNSQYRGVWMLYDVVDGEFETVPVPLKFLSKHYTKPHRRH
jgi:hypothetical protein